MLDTSPLKTQFAGAAIGTMVMSMAMALFSYRESQAITEAIAQPTQQFDGVLELHDRKLLIRSGATIAFECQVSHCGYPNIADDAGKQSIVWVGDGRILKIQNDLGTRDAALAARTGKTQKSLVWLLVTCASVVWLVLLRRRKQ
jgi:hypothetical protein